MYNNRKLVRRTWCYKTYAAEWGNLYVYEKHIKCITKGKKGGGGTFLVVEWLGLQASTAGRVGSIRELKIPQAVLRSRKTKSKH